LATRATVVRYASVLSLTPRKHPPNHNDKLKHIGHYNFKSGDAAPCEVHLTTALELRKYLFVIGHFPFLICHLALYFAFT